MHQKTAKNFQPRNFFFHFDFPSSLKSIFRPRKCKQLKIFHFFPAWKSHFYSTERQLFDSRMREPHFFPITQKIIWRCGNFLRFLLNYKRHGFGGFGRTIAAKILSNYQRGMVPISWWQKASQIWKSSLILRLCRARCIIALLSVIIKTGEMLSKRRQRMRVVFPAKCVTWRLKRLRGGRVGYVVN